MEADEKNLIGTPRKREGDVPDAYTWTIHYEKRGSGTVSPALSYDDGSGLIAHEWPEEECCIDTIRERWGEGCYRVRWWGRSAADNTRSQRGAGKLVELAPVGPQVRIAAPPPVAAPPVDPLAMYRAAQTDSLQGFAAIASLMRDMGGGARGQSAEVAEERFSLFRRETLLAVQQQFDALAKANAAALDGMARELAEARKQIAQLRDELAEWEDADDEDDEDGEEEQAPARARPKDLKGVVTENALDGLDGIMREMGPAVMPVVAGYVGALQKKAEAQADAAKANADAHREALRQMQTDPPAATATDEAAQ